MCMLQVKVYTGGFHCGHEFATSGGFVFGTTHLIVVLSRSVTYRILDFCRLISFDFILSSSTIFSD